MARKKKPEKKGNPNAWMVTFSDLLTLMLTFFVLLISMSSLDDQKLEEAFNSMIQVDGTDIMDELPVMSTGRAEDRLFVIRKSLIQAIAFEQSRIGASMVRIEVSGGKNLAYSEEIEGSADVTPEGGGDAKTPQATPEANGVSVPEEDNRLEIFADERGLVVRLPSDITFASGRAALKPAFKLVLESIGRTVKEKDLVAVVEGHTDNRPISTLRYPSNWELSMARGAAATRFLVDVVGVPAGRLAASGYGDVRPISSNKTPYGRQKNRRIEVILNLRQPEKVNILTNPEQGSEKNG